MVIKINYTSSDVYVSTSVSPVYVVVNYSGTSGTGGNFVPYTGATANVDLGEYELKAGQVTLDTTPTGTAAVATTRWNDTAGISETTLKGGNVILKNGVDLVARVVNKVTPNATLTKAAYQAVKISGAQGQRLAVALAQANNDAGSADTIGLVTETIATNQEGFIMTVGNLEGINTTGSLQGETWADGDVLYLSPTTAGALTNIKPNGSTGHIVVIGYVEYSHINNGKIYVKIMNGWELDELHNVFIDTPLNNQVLTYESSTSLWKNKTPTGGGTTIYTGDGTLTGDRTIGTTSNYNLTISPTTTFNPILSTINPTGIKFVTNANNISANLTGVEIDLINAVNAFSNKVLIIKYAGTEYINFRSDGTGENSVFRLLNGSSLQGASLVSAGAMTITSTTLSISAPGGQVGVINCGGDLSLQRSGTNAFRLFNATGNVSIQNGGTFSDTGERLQVNGTARVSGAMTVTGNLTNTAGVTITKNINMETDGTTAGRIEYAVSGGNLINIGRFSPSSGTGTARPFYVLYRTPDYGSTAQRVMTMFTDNGIMFRDEVAAAYGNPTQTTSAFIEMVSTTRGFLPPRMTTTEKNAIGTPAAGLMVFDTTLVKLCVYNGTAWETITSI